MATQRPNVYQHLRDQGVLTARDLLHKIEEMSDRDLDMPILVARENGEWYDYVEDVMPTGEEDLLWPTIFLCKKVGWDPLDL